MIALETAAVRCSSRTSLPQARLTNDLQSDSANPEAGMAGCIVNNAPRGDLEQRSIVHPPSNHGLVEGVARLMDVEWEEVGRLLLPPPGPQGIPTPVQTLAFDGSQELLWAGNGFGRVSSFYGTELQSYTSFRAGEGPVHAILAHDKGIIAITSRSVHMAVRRGLPLWHISHEDMKDLRCGCYASKGTSEILVAGLQDQMFAIDVEKGTIIKQLLTADHYTILKRSRYICGATQKGSINILDTTNFTLVRSWAAHQALINDMDTQSDYIVTCGYSLRQGQNYMLDPLVNCFDLKNMVPLPPIPFPAGAAFVRMHPRMSSTSIIVSQQGQIHVVDLNNVNTSNVKHANVMTYLSMIEIAPSGEAVVLADMDCYVHLWGSPSRIRFAADVSHPTEFPDPEEVPPTIEWSLESPFSNAGMPFYREQLLSAWQSHMLHEIGAPPGKLDQQLMSSFKPTEWGGYGRLAHPVRRNQMENTRTTEKAATSLQAPKFLSEKEREIAYDGSGERRISDVADAIGATELSSLKAEVPVMYRNVEIKYSKFGVDDFDFGFYNKTPYSGLEIHISNSYANPLLQVLHFTPLIRNLALQHTATACVREECLLCELGFLFDMLEKAEGSICQATNLLKTFSNDPQAGRLGLLEEDSPGASLTTMLQGLTRFLLNRLAEDWKALPPHSRTLGQVLSTDAITSIRCMNCRNEQNRDGSTYVTELAYPLPKLMVRNARTPKLTFSQILKSSVERETSTRGWCSRCQRYQSLATRKTIRSVPLILVLNAAINSAEARQFWSIPGWLPNEIGVILDGGQFFCYEGEDLRLHLQRGIHHVTVYSLIGFAAEIDSGQHQKSHLVSLVNIAHSQHVAPEEPQWHLFNDFLVRPIQSGEALTFNTAWKLPSVITYQMKAHNNRIEDSWKHNLDTSILYADENTTLGERTYRPLSPQHEAPGDETIIALDTEFVAVRQPEIEVNSEGERETIRPIVYALARVSVVRGSGEDEGLPFIDDYIASKEPIVDYLTNYSGIVHGDLDRRISKRHLVSLKVAYKKLWMLLNLGCKFLGHGLKQDFRVTNIHVPKAQVIDTIECFFVKARLRKLSLAFLAWYLLKEDIQLETHDSIEDARTALKLYRKYLEFQDAGVLENILQEIYRKGREMNYKPPVAKSKDGHLVQRMETPPIPLEGGHGPLTQGQLPTTPVRRPIGLAPATGGSLFSGSGSGWTPGRGSPLR